MNCGIYKITNTINGKIYIGSSINIKQRFGVHISKLNNKKHHSIYLQRAWNKYGKDSFIFGILLYCDEKNLKFYEDRAIEGFKSLNNKFGYNIRPAERRDLTGDNFKNMCQKISKAHKGLQTGKNHPCAKSVKINGKYYDTMIEAAKDLEIPYQSLIYRLKNKISLDKFFSNKGKYNPNAKAIIADWKYYETMTEAAKKLGVYKTTIKYRIKINKPGYFWA